MMEIWIEICCEVENLNLVLVSECKQFLDVFLLREI